MKRQNSESVPTIFHCYRHIVGRLKTSAFFLLIEVPRPLTPKCLFVNVMRLKLAFHLPSIRKPTIVQVQSEQIPSAFLHGDFCATLFYNFIFPSLSTHK